MSRHVDDEYEWDTEKSEEIYRRWGFDFFVARSMLASENYEEEPDGHDHSDGDYWVATGPIGGFFITVVYTRRQRRKRIVTAWPASTDEINEYTIARGYLDEWQDQSG